MPSTVPRRSRQSPARLSASHSYRQGFPDGPPSADTCKKSGDVPRCDRGQEYWGGGGLWVSRSGAPSWAQRMFQQERAQNGDLRDAFFSQCRKQSCSPHPHQTLSSQATAPISEPAEPPPTCRCRSPTGQLRMEQLSRAWDKQLAQGLPGNPNSPVIPEVLL